MLSKIKRRRFLQAAGAMALGGVPRLRGQAPPSGVMQPVLTRGYSNTRDCANLNEKILTVANVQQRGLRQTFQLPLEGDARGCEAQPLIIPSVQMEADGLTHDILIACSMNNLVYCFDANDSAILWTTKVAGYPVNGSTKIDMWKVNDHFGIISSPVADPETFELYAVAWVSPDGNPQTATHHFVVLDIRNGQVLRNISMDSLTYSPGHGLPDQPWRSPTMRKQRSSLLLASVNEAKSVFFCAGSVLETAGNAAGWVVAYDCASKQFSATLDLAPHYGGAGVWMAGQGIAADSQGNLFLVTGNGAFDGVTDFAESVLRLKYTPPTNQIGSHAAANLPPPPNGKLEVVDWWTPYSDAGRMGKSPSWPTPNYSGDAVNPNKLAGVSAPSEQEERDPVNKMPDMDMSNAHMIGNRMVMKPKATVSGAYADQDLGSSGVAVLEEYGFVIFSGKDGIYYVCHKDALGRTKPSDFLNPAANYAKAASIGWFTYYPGPDVSPTPKDFSDLDFLYAGRSHHMHATPVIAKIGGEYRCWCWGENGNLRCWRVNRNGTLTYLGCSAEVASPNAPVPSGGMAGGQLCLSCNQGDPATAIVWAAVPLGDVNKGQPPAPGQTGAVLGNLYAYDAWNIGQYDDGSGALRLIWKSPNVIVNKFMSPVISGGRLFYADYAGKILCYGLA